MDLGTTILAMRYNNGVIVGTDSRITVSEYVSNPFSSKVAFVLDPIVDYNVKPSCLNFYGDLDTLEYNSFNNITVKEQHSTCCICHGGSSADTQYITDCLQTELITRRILYRFHESVTSVAHSLHELISSYHSIANNLICAGYDHLKKCGVIYSISPCGSIFEAKEGWATFGCGSPYITSVFDAQYPKLIGSINDSSILWSEDEAIQFVLKSISYAICRDEVSGGFIRIYIFDGNGKREVVARTKIKNS